MTRTSGRPTHLLLSLAAVATLLVGCTGLTEELSVSPTPSVTERIMPSPSPEPVPQKPVILEPEDDETVVLRLSSKDAMISNRITLGQGETFASLTCMGTGPITVSFSETVSYTTDCEWFAGNNIQRNSDLIMSGKTVEVNVESQPGQEWQLLVTQKKS